MLLVIPGRWFRNKTSQLVCICQKVSGGWVTVRYFGSGLTKPYRIEQFIQGFESTVRPRRTK